MNNDEFEFPDYVPRQLPEGSYTFTLKKKPEKRWKGEEGNKFITITFTFRVSGEEISNEWQHTESCLGGDERYSQILEALGGEKSPDGRVHLGKVNIEDYLGRGFDADIVHEPDKDDPRKKYARITNIKAIDGDDIPF